MPQLLHIIDTNSGPIVSYLSLSPAPQRRTEAIQFSIVSTMAKRTPDNMDIDDRGGKISANDYHHYQCPRCHRQLTGSHEWVLVTGTETGGWYYVCKECMDQDKNDKVAKDDKNDNGNNNNNDDQDCEMVG